MLGVVVGTLCASTAIAEPQDGLCRPCEVTHSPCFTIQGRLSAFQGTSWRLWRLGTNRVVGVLDGTGTEAEDHEKIIPDTVWLLLSKAPDRPAVRGTYTLCPLTPERHKEMQMVCMKDATNLSQVTLRSKPPSLN
jgi:hypothetical protein